MRYPRRLYARTRRPVPRRPLVAGTGAIPTVEHIHYRFRDGVYDPSGINTAFDAGDTAEDTVASVRPDTIFRLRIAIQGTDGVTSIPTGTLQERHDLTGGTSYTAWTAVTNVASDPFGSGVQKYDVQCVPTTSFIDLAATANSAGITDGTGTFVAGSGSHDNSVPAVTVSGDQWTEHEFTLYVGKMTSDGHVPDSARFQFRYLTSGPNETFTVTPEMTVENWPGHLGGTAVETPHRMIVEETASSVDPKPLYALIEIIGTVGGTYQNRPAIMKSEDGGVVWNVVDIGGGLRNDQETGTLLYDGADTIHHVRQSQSDDVFYQKFYTSTHATTPDTWDATYETIRTVTGAINDQMGAGELRSDGTVVAVWNEAVTNDAGRFAIRETTPSWSGPTAIDTTAICHPPRTVLDTDDVVHMFWLKKPTSGGTTTNGIIRHGTIDPADDSLGTQHDAATGATGNDAAHTTMPSMPVIWTEGGTKRVGVLWVKDGTTGTNHSGGELNFTWSVIPSNPMTGTYSWTTEKVTDSTDECIVDAVGSGSVSACVVAHGPDLIAVWVDYATKNVKMDRRSQGSWGTDTTVYSGGDATLLAGVSITTDSRVVVLIDRTELGGNGTVRVEFIEVTDLIPSRRRRPAMKVR